ncbi:MAG: acetyl-CoA hydrolase [Betaproteobacteria bacterium]|nr:acetyl-CoA hydrolase [Betaproteobacteria bacterium]
MKRAGPASRFDFTAVLRGGDAVSWPQGTGEPASLTRRLVAQRHALAGIDLFIGMMTSDTLLPECADGFRIRALNGAGSNRRLAAAGLLDILPVPVSTVPELLRSRKIPVDIALIRVRPSAKAGCFSAGVVTDYTQALVAAARCVIAELDERMPLTAQDALIAEDDVDFLVDADGDPVLLTDPEPNAVEMRVAEQVAARIPEGATLQLGIGGLPVAVCRALQHHRKLGVHSGVVSDIVVDLIEQGVIDHSNKGADAGKMVTGGLFGSERLNRHADGNPAVEMRSVEYTHNPLVMAGVRNLYAINSAIEVDLSGQVNAEVAGTRYIGAVGGHGDFVRGAQASPGGRSIIALPSTTPDGRHSRIVDTLDGRPVTTGRADMDMVVTEYGVAELKGCSLSERAWRLLAITHPDFRQRLSASLKQR